jgi:hypothetical protein
MNAEVTYDRYNDPPRWVGPVVIVCFVAVVIFALWVFVPAAMEYFAPSPQATEPDESASRPIVFDTAPSPVASPDIAAAVARSAGSAVAIDTAPQAADASRAVETPVEDAPATTATLPAPHDAAASWAASESATPADALPIARPPLPRMRPRDLMADGTLAIPLPRARPDIPTDTTATVPDAPADRQDSL